MSVANILMSSPAGISRYDPQLISSSPPGLPEIGDLLQKSAKKRALGTLNNVASLPASGMGTFMSAANMLRAAPEIDIETEQPVHSPTQTPKRTRSRTNTSSGSSSPDEKPWQKFKSPNSKSKEPSTNTAANVMETVVETSIAPKIPLKKVNKNFSDVEKEIAMESLKCKIPEDTPVMDEAMKRRKDWTPPPADPIFVHGSDSDLHEVYSPLGAPRAPKEVFQNLLDSFGHRSGETSTSDQPSGADAAVALKKRKRIQCVSTHGGTSPTRERSPVKKKPVRKKATTITGKATAAYAPQPTSTEQGEAEDGANDDSILEYFPPQGSISLEQPKKAAKKGSKATPKAGVKSRKKKGTIKEPILLSPDSALRQATAQDFLFGTSSQLAREQSPEFLRDLQMAIRASNQEPEDDPFASSPEGPTEVAQPRKRLWDAGARDGAGDVMNIEVVDLTDSPFTGRDSVDMRHLTLATQIMAGEDPQLVEDDDLMPVRSARPAPSVTDGDDDGLKASQSRFFEATQVAVKESLLESNTDSTQPGISTITTSNARIDLENIQGESSSTHDARNTHSVPKSSRKNQAPTTRPNYELFTDAQLARQITTYGFKPVKKRTAMIALLDQCWASKNQTAMRSPGAIATISTTALASSPKKSKESVTASVTSPIKRPRGRPRRDSTPTDPQTTAATTRESPPKKARGRPKKVAKAVDEHSGDHQAGSRTKVTTAVAPTPKQARKPALIEIADSDEEDALSPSSLSSPDPVFSSPSQGDLSLGQEDDLTLDVSPTDQQADLFARITKAVKAMPPTKDLQNPSWHEKMLLYDPIVLEDFTAWLNTGALTEYGYDGEVSPGEVKKWCESKSVICLWRVNLNGKERKRY